MINFPANVNNKNIVNGHFLDLDAFFLLAGYSEINFKFKKHIDSIRFWVSSSHR
jgi:hypothetical protein